MPIFIFHLASLFSSSSSLFSKFSSEIKIAFQRKEDSLERNLPPTGKIQDLKPNSLKTNSEFPLWDGDNDDNSDNGDNGDNSGNH